MTRLTPSTYSSRQTTHSTCLPMCFLHSLDSLAFFSCSGGRGVCGGICKGWELTRIKSPGSGIPVVVLDRGRGLIGGEFWRRGVVADELVGLGNLGDWFPGD